MMQQVNLYQPILRKQEKVFSASTMLQGNMVVLVGLALLYLYTVMQTQDMRSQLRQATKERNEQVTLNAELLAKYPPKRKDAALAGRIEKARMTLQQKRMLLTQVKTLGLDTTVHFSEHLEALARQDMPSLWLSYIQLRHGQQVVLHGSAYKADDLPVYLQRLSEEKVFAGTAFQSVVIERNEEIKGRVDFAINTQLPEEEAAVKRSSGDGSAARAYLAKRRSTSGN